MRIAERASRVAGSATLEVLKTAAALRAEGVDVVDLSIGEPDFPTPEFVGRAGMRAIESGKTKYTDVSGEATAAPVPWRSYRRACAPPCRTAV